MQFFVYLLLLTPFVSLHPASPNRVYFPEEDDPEYHRFLLLEDEDGKLVHIDLRNSSGVTKDVTPDGVSFDLYNAKSNSPYTFNMLTVNDNTFRSHFDNTKTTVLIAHGWNNDRDSSINTLIRDAILTSNGFNVIITDWSEYARTINYLSAVAAVPEVGKIVAQLVNKIQGLYNWDGSHFILIGHSLGAHVMGHAGKHISKKVQYIIGLDPAQPGFSVSNSVNRLANTDATVVQVIHTCGELLGFKSAIGTVDYFPNGGNKQPGCGLDVTGKCSHGRSYQYLAEAVLRGSVFKGVLCSDYSTYENGNCNGNKVSYMGQLKASTGETGDYFLHTNSQSPYGQGS